VDSLVRWQPSSRVLPVVPQDSEVLTLFLLSPERSNRRALPPALFPGRWIVYRLLDSSGRPGLLRLPHCRLSVGVCTLPASLRPSGFVFSHLRTLRRLQDRTGAARRRAFNVMRSPITRGSGIPAARIAAFMPGSALRRKGRVWSSAGGVKTHRHRIPLKTGGSRANQQVESELTHIITPRRHGLLITAHVEAIRPPRHKRHYSTRTRSAQPHAEGE
jgi:hypothetical protein